MNAVKVLCCYTNGCNENIKTAERSKELIDEPISAEEMQIFLQKANFILKTERLTFNINISKESERSNRESKMFLPLPVEKNSSKGAKFYQPIIFIVISILRATQARV